MALAGTWSSHARMAATDPRSTFAVAPDRPKQNAMLQGGDDEGRSSFARTLPLSALMQADAAASQSKAATLGRSMQRSLTPNSLTQTLRPASFSHTQPLLPPGEGYSAALERVHRERGDRLARQPRGWSQSWALEQARREAERQGSVITVYAPAVAEEVLHAARAHERQSDQVHRAKAKQRRPAFVPSPDPSSSSHSLDAQTHDALLAALDPAARAAEAQARTQRKLRQFWTDVGAEQQRRQQHIKARMERKLADAEAQFDAMLARLGDNRALLADIGDYLRLHAHNEDSQREQLYKRWCEQVHAPVQQAIQGRLAQRSTSSIERRRRALFERFLQASERGLQLAATDPDARDEPEEKQAQLHAKVSVRVKDPLKERLEQRADEQRLWRRFFPDQALALDAEQRAQQAAHGVDPSGLRELLDPYHWSSGKIESTPHGRYSLLRGNVTKGCGKRAVAPSSSYAAPDTAQRALDHYELDRSDETRLRQYWRHGGKRVEGFVRDATRRDYNVVAPTEPSFARRYPAAAAAAAGSPPGSAGCATPVASASPSPSVNAPGFPTHAVQLQHSIALPPISPSPQAAARPQSQPVKVQQAEASAE